MAQLTYPGVYIEEVPSGNRTITGVATSITAFAGRTWKGPTDRATRITSYSQFEKLFGGLWQESPLSYSVRQFFQNGGSDAVIVRIVNPAGEPALLALADEGGNDIMVEEARNGSGGSSLRIQVTDDGAARHVVVSELARSPAGAEIVTRTADYSGADAAALRAAIQADDSLIVLAEESEEFTDLPIVAGPSLLADATPAAAPAMGTLPLAAPALTLQAAVVGASENLIAVTILHSASDEAFYSVVVERRQNDGSFNLLNSVTAVTNASVQAAVAAAAGIGIVLTGTPADLQSRPLAVTRRMLSGGTDAAEAILNLATDGLALSAANPGTWGNRLNLHVNGETADVGDDTLFNLTVELLNDEDQPTVTETFLNVSVDPTSPRFLTTLLEQGSLLVRAVGELPAIAPTATDEDGVLLAGGHDGGEVEAEHFTGTGMQGAKQGLYQLEDVDLFNLLVIPPLARAVDVPDPLWADALAYATERRAMLLIDPPGSWNRPDQAITGVAAMASLRSPNSILYFPRVQMADPLRDNMIDTFAPSGILAGLFSRTDAQRGVWKAPAGLEASLRGVRSLSYRLIDAEVGQLNPLGINCLQVRPAAGPVAWGARTLMGDDRLASEWKYIPVRRIALMIEESLYRGTQFAVFEPNDKPLWQQLRLAAGTFMNNLFRRGAFQGSSPDEAYFVKCDDETTTQADIDSGIVNLEVGFSPLKPAEFIVIRIRQMAGQSES